MKEGEPWRLGAEDFSEDLSGLFNVPGRDIQMRDGSERHATYAIDEHSFFL